MLIEISQIENLNVLCKDVNASFFADRISLVENWFDGIEN